MLYAILSEDVPDSLEKRKSVRPAHLKRLQELQDVGKLIIAGPHPAIDSNTPAEAGFTGSLVIAEFADLRAAQQWADVDPYVEAGIYAKVSVKPFKQTFPQ
ncbi:MAG: YciI family protein [Methylococcales symbiont of Hymedesmia sp. n. MRB-2018]|nr:MAG: YciI family protein [Methylococcales symbiont of Hymedesmia sp. n. MRB-2018]